MLIRVLPSNINIYFLKTSVSCSLLHNQPLNGNLWMTFGSGVVIQEQMQLL